MDEATVSASRLSFPMQLMISIVSTVIAVVVAILGATSSIRSDVRDIATRMELREAMYETKFRGLEEQLADQRRQLALLQVNFDQFRLDFYREAGKTQPQR